MGSDTKENTPSVSLFSLSNYGQVKLGRGLIGKTGWALVAAIVALGLIGAAMTGSHYLQFTVVIIIALLFAGWCAGAFWYARNHPEALLLEGAELLQWRQMDMAAKGATQILPTTNTEPPLLIEKPED